MKYTWPVIFQRRKIVAGIGICFCILWSVAAHTVRQSVSSDHVTTFTTANYDISNRPQTVATANWNPPAWDAVGEAGPEQRTSDLSAVVQEIVNRPGWLYGNALAFIITGNGVRVADSFNGNLEEAPRLHVEYTSDALPADTPAPTPLPPGIHYRFAVIGDYGDNSARTKRVAHLIAGWNPDFVITLGDNNYPDGEAATIDENVGQYYSQFIGNYQGAYGSGSPTNRFWPTPGNHDWHSISCNATECSGPYFDYFTLPGNERYYDVDFGLIHLFAVDGDFSEPDSNRREGVQAGWLQATLMASTSCFKVVYFHNSPYSSGYHGSQLYMQWPFADWGADVVLSGHDHDYERLEVAGLPYFVNGLGGGSITSFANVGNLPPGAASLARYNQDGGAMLVDVTADRMLLQFYNTAELLIDEYTINKSCSIVSPTTLALSPAPLPTETAMPTATLASTPTAVPTLTATNTPMMAMMVTPTAVPTISPLPTGPPQTNDATGRSFWLLSVPAILVAGWLILRSIRHQGQ